MQIQPPFSAPIAPSFQQLTYPNLIYQPAYYYIAPLPCSPIIPQNTLFQTSSINTTQMIQGQETFNPLPRHHHNRKHRKRHHRKHHPQSPSTQFIPRTRMLRKRSHTPKYSSTSSYSSSTHSSSPVSLSEITEAAARTLDYKPSVTVTEKEISVTTETIEDHIQEIMNAAIHNTGTQCLLQTHTRMDAALAEITDGELQEFLESQPNSAESMRRTEQWVLTLYEPWCIKTKKDKPFPLEEKNVCAFVRFMAIKCGYTLKGIELIVIPCLKHLNFDVTGTNNPRVSSMLKEEIKNLRHNPNVTVEGEGKPPLCYFDVAELIRRIPNNLSFKAMEASLFLFALHTGSRALTCEAIRYRDIVFVEKDDTTHALRVIINQEVTKGNPNWNHPVCIEGFTDIENTLDVVYYLNKHCIHAVGKSLEEIVSRTDDKANDFDDLFIWPFKRDAMRERLKTRLVQTGFPARRWSFHSLRSGHICSCLLVAGSDAGRKASVLETSAITAGWKMYGTSQRRYIKKVAERTIVSSRLIGAGIGLYNYQTGNSTSTCVADTPCQTTSNDKSSSSTSTEEQSKFIVNLKSTIAAEGFIHAPHTSEAFHLIQLKEAHIPVGVFLRDLRVRFDQAFLNAEGSEADKKRHCFNSFNRLMTIWGAKEAESRTIKSSWKMNRQLGHDHLVKLLVFEHRDTWELADSMIAELLSYGIDPKIIPPKQTGERKTTDVIPTVRPMIIGRTNRVSRRRKPWTEEEDTVIIEAKKNHLSFNIIMDKLPDRFPRDAYWRWKLLVKKNKNLEQYD